MENNLNEQIFRLQTQLDDLKVALAEGDIDEDEYLTEKEETVKELEEYEAKLSKLKESQGGESDNQSSNKSSVTEQMKEREALSIRSKLRTLEEERRLKRCSEEEFYKKTKDNIILLQKLGITLSESEKKVLDMDKETYIEISQNSDSVSSSVSSGITSQIKK